MRIHRTSPSPTHDRHTGTAGRTSAPPVVLGIVFYILAALFPAVPAQATDSTRSASPYLPEISSYIQFRYTDPNKDDDRWAIRRFKTMLDGGPKEGLHYHLQCIYKTNNSATDDQVFLQDAYLIYPVAGVFSFKAGQFIPLFGLERFQPDWNLDFVDRTDVTSRLVVDGNLGDSFARDQGLETDWSHEGWDLSAGLFHGSGANNGFHKNGPLGVGRISYGRSGSLDDRDWSFKTGLGQSIRHDNDLNLSGELPGLNKKITGHFTGGDQRFNGFAQANWGPLRAQGEYFHVRLSSSGTADDITAVGAYGQVAYLPVHQVILSLRREWFNPDTHGDFPSTRLWTAGVTYDFKQLPLRLATDCTWPDSGTPGSPYVWRLQVQYLFLNKFKLSNI